MVHTPIWVKTLRKPEPSLEQLHLWQREYRMVKRNLPAGIVCVGNSRQRKQHMQRHVGLKECNLLGELRLIGYKQTFSDDFNENTLYLFFLF